MLFTSPVFLFLFLPAVLVVYFLLARAWRNAFLLVASLFFYAWGEGGFVLVMLASVALNYLFGRAIESAGSRRGVVAAVAVAVNLALLGSFKYANFLVDNLDAILRALGGPSLRLAAVHLPIGISFFTFHALSYLIDVKRGRVRALRNAIDFGLYIALFPQLIAGPIVRYHQIAGQIATRTIGRAGFAPGVRRFVFGLGKKMLIANTLALPADAIFGIPPRTLTGSLAWFGVLLYTLQIYCDFSAYSDMAIGLAKMLGFDFPENVAHPYVSRSITEFWRRWHISLSTWFRDYLYIPLGGNRRGTARTYLNLLTVFFLCGLWHGASWTFVVWGLFHGTFLVIERAGLGARLDRAPRTIGHLYAMLVVGVGWVLFRAPTLSHGLGFVRAMAGFSPGSAPEYGPALYVGTDVALAVAAGILVSTPFVSHLSRFWKRRTSSASTAGRAFALDTAAALAEVTVLVAVSVASAVTIAAGTYNPFIYFRF